MRKLALAIVSVALGPPWVCAGTAYQQLEVAAATGRGAAAARSMEAGSARAAGSMDGAKAAPAASLVAGGPGAAPTLKLAAAPEKVRSGTRLSDLDEEFALKAEDSGAFATLGYALISPVIAPISFTAAGIVAGSAVGDGLGGTAGSVVGGFLGGVGGLALGAILGVVGLVTGVFKGIGKLFQGKP